MCAFFAELLNVPTEPKGKPFKDPVFLIGLMRSGTTLLMNTLSEHPQLLKAGFELNRVWSDIGGAPCSVNCDERTEAHFKQEYANNMTAYFSKYIEDSKSIKRYISRWSEKRYYNAGSISYDWENVRIMNKSPHLSHKIRYLNAMYPNAKFIVIIRSPYGQSASLKMHLLKYHKNEKYYFELKPNSNTCWTNWIDPDLEKLNKERLFPGNFKLIPEYWMRMNNLIFDHLKHIPKERQIVFSYEDLVVNQEKTLGSIFKFLDLDPKHRKSELDIIKKKQKIQNTDTKGNPLTKWKRYLNREEQKAIDLELLNNKTIFDNIRNQVLNASTHWIK